MDRAASSHRFRRAVLGLVALGLFAASIAVTGVFLVGGGFEGGVPVRAVFSAPGIGQQLSEGGDIKVRGVLVGRIVSIDTDGSERAVITFRLNDDVRLPETSRAEIRSKTIFGEKWVELLPPDGDTGDLLTAGSTIPDARTVEPLELERAMQLGHDLISEIPMDDLSAAFKALADGFGGNEKDARRAMDRGLVALKAVNARSAEFDLSLRQLNEFSAWLDENDDTLLSFMRSLDANNRALVGAAPEFRASLDSVPTFLNDFAAFQVQTEDELGRLIEEGATVAEFVAVRSDRLVDIVVQLEAFTTVWNSGLSQPCGGVFENDMVCWQVYQVPGMDSRGLYGTGQAPETNDPYDPLLAARTAEMLRRSLSEESGRPAPTELAELLFAAVRQGR
jgi:phospholipid/cholesterol/gamma-HCH transport system substrate-binding protein